MTYLVTGGAGFLGVSLVRRLLSEGRKVRVLDNLYRGNCDSLIELTKNKNFEFIRGDITSKTDIKKAISGVDGIFHLAAIVGNPSCLKNPSLSEAVNVAGTRDLLDLKSREQRLVFCSTESVYGDVSEYKETVAPCPSSIYANQKYQAEQETLYESNTIAFRFAAAMGLSVIPRINLLVNTLVYEAITNKSLIIFEGDVQRNFISVEDMVDTLLFGMFGNPTYNLYNSGNISYSKMELAQYISLKTGCHVFYGDVNKDLDKRDKKLDCSRISSDGFLYKVDMEETLDELIKGLPLLEINHNYC
jgi:nucleoside-diphosphate-sugar epimerase